MRRKHSSCPVGYAGAGLKGKLHVDTMTWVVSVSSFCLWNVVLWCACARVYCDSY